MGLVVPPITYVQDFAYSSKRYGLSARATRFFWSGFGLFLMMTGSVAAYFLTSINQDLRQQAYGGAPSGGEVAVTSGTQPNVNELVYIGGYGWVEPAKLEAFYPGQTCGVNGAGGSCCPYDAATKSCNGQPAYSIEEWQGLRPTGTGPVYNCVDGDVACLRREMTEQLAQGKTPNVTSGKVDPKTGKTEVTTFNSQVELAKAIPDEERLPAEEHTIAAEKLVEDSKITSMANSAIGGLTENQERARQANIARNDLRQGTTSKEKIAAAQSSYDQFCNQAIKDTDTCKNLNSAIASAKTTLVDAQRIATTQSAENTQRDTKARDATATLRAGASTAERIKVAQTSYDTNCQNRSSTECEALKAAVASAQAGAAEAERIRRMQAAETTARTTTAQKTTPSKSTQVVAPPEAQAAAKAKNALLEAGLAAAGAGQVAQGPTTLPNPDAANVRNAITASTQTAAGALLQAQTTAQEKAAAANTAATSALSAVMTGVSATSSKSNQAPTGQGGDIAVDATLEQVRQIEEQKQKAAQALQQVKEISNLASGVAAQTSKVADQVAEATNKAAVAANIAAQTQSVCNTVDSNELCFQLIAAGRGFLPEVPSEADQSLSRLNLAAEKVPAPFRNVAAAFNTIASFLRIGSQSVASINQGADAMTRDLAVGNVKPAVAEEYWNDVCKKTPELASCTQLQIALNNFSKFEAVDEAAKQAKIAQHVAVMDAIFSLNKDKDDPEFNYQKSKDTYNQSCYGPYEPSTQCQALKKLLDQKGPQNWFDRINNAIISRVEDMTLYSKIQVPNNFNPTLNNLGGRPLVQANEFGDGEQNRKNILNVLPSADSLQDLEEKMGTVFTVVRATSWEDANRQLWEKYPDLYAVIQKANDSKGALFGNTAITNAYAYQRQQSDNDQLTGVIFVSEHDFDNLGQIRVQNDQILTPMSFLTAEYLGFIQPLNLALQTRGDLGANIGAYANAIVVVVPDSLLSKNTLIAKTTINDITPIPVDFIGDTPFFWPPNVDFTFFESDPFGATSDTMVRRVSIDKNIIFAPLALDQIRETIEVLDGNNQSRQVILPTFSIDFRDAAVQSSPYDRQPITSELAGWEENNILAGGAELSDVMSGLGYSQMISNTSGLQMAYAREFGVESSVQEGSANYNNVNLQYSITVRTPMQSNALAENEAVSLNNFTATRFGGEVQENAFGNQNSLVAEAKHVPLEGNVFTELYSSNMLVVTMEDKDGTKLALPIPNNFEMWYAFEDPDKNGDNTFDLNISAAENFTSAFQEVETWANNNGYQGVTISVEILTSSESLSIDKDPETAVIAYAPIEVDSSLTSTDGVWSDPTREYYISWVVRPAGN